MDIKQVVTTLFNSNDVKLIAKSFDSVAVRYAYQDVNNETCNMMFYHRELRKVAYIADYDCNIHMLNAIITIAIRMLHDVALMKVAERNEVKNILASTTTLDMTKFNHRIA